MDCIICIFKLHSHWAFVNIILLKMLVGSTNELIKITYIGPILLASRGRTDYGHNFFRHWWYSFSLRHSLSMSVRCSYNKHFALWNKQVARPSLTGMWGLVTGWVCVHTQRYPIVLEASMREGSQIPNQLLTSPLISLIICSTIAQNWWCVSR